MNYETLILQSKVSIEDFVRSVGELSFHQHFLLNLPPRFGKSRVSTELINKWVTEESKILILSGANSTNNQWLENLQSYNPHLLDITDVYCYQSLHKIDREKYDIICLDEADLITGERFKQLLEFNPDHWIAMSGTLEEEDTDLFRQLTKNKFFNVEVQFQKAVDWGILPEPKIYAVKLEFDDTKPYLIYYASKDKKKKNEIVEYRFRWDSLKNKKVNTLIKCTELQYHELICNEFERWKGYEQEFNLEPDERSDTINFLISKGFSQSTCRDKKMRLGNERKKFFADIKNRHFKKLFSQLPQGSRVLVFCNDTAQADLLNEEFSVHSNKPDSIELVEQFNTKQIDKLFSIKMLERGVDFKDVDYLVIIQSSMKQGGQIQKFARSGLSVAPKTILFYYGGTQDEKYVQEFLKQFKPEWIIHKTL